MTTTVTQSSPGTGDSWTLVRAVQQGDLRKFGELYQAYSGFVLRYFIRRGHSIESAEDLTSESFVRALRAINSVSFQGKDIGAWLITIARNLANDYAKSSAVRWELVTADLPDRPRGDSGPDSKAASMFELDRVAIALRQLTAEQRSCLIMRRVLGRSVQETAAHMGRTSGAVKALLHRAAVRLDEAILE